MTDTRPLSKGALILVDDQDANGHYRILRAKVIRCRGLGVLALVLADDDSETTQKIRCHRNEVTRYTPPATLRAEFPPQGNGEGK